jgi:hypothetical protein
MDRLSGYIEEKIFVRESITIVPSDELSDEGGDKVGFGCKSQYGCCQDVGCCTHYGCCAK